MLWFFAERNRYKLRYISNKIKRQNSPSRQACFVVTHSSGDVHRIEVYNFEFFLITSFLCREGVAYHAWLKLQSVWENLLTRDSKLLYLLSKIDKGKWNDKTYKIEVYDFGWFVITYSPVGRSVLSMLRLTEPCKNYGSKLCMTILLRLFYLRLFRLQANMQAALWENMLEDISWFDFPVRIEFLVHSWVFTTFHAWLGTARKKNMAQRNWNFPPRNFRDCNNIREICNTPYFNSICLLCSFLISTLLGIEPSWFCDHWWSRS